MDYGFIRVSTGSQDAESQRRDILDAYPDAVIVTTDTRSASASKGEQVDAIYGLIARLNQGDRIIVTESSRLDRREDLDAQAEVLLKVRTAGGDVVSIAEPAFGKTDFAGRIVTLVAQHSNAEKSLTVKRQTYRGVKSIAANRAHYGALPSLWSASGIKYQMQAACTDPVAVADIYRRIGNGETIMSVCRRYDLYPKSLRALIQFKPNYTGVIECHYAPTADGLEPLSWTHTVEPVVTSDQWHRANERINANKSGGGDKGGRPVGEPSNWLSGVFKCPECGGRLHVTAGKTPAGNERTPKLRCAGSAKERLSCKRFKTVPIAGIEAQLDEMFAADDSLLYKFDRIPGNAHVLAELQSRMEDNRARRRVCEDDDELDALQAERKMLQAEIAAFVAEPDRYDYAPTGDTLGSFYRAGKVRVVKAFVKYGLTLNTDGIVSTDGPSEDMREVAEMIVDLGDGVCFKFNKVLPALKAA